MNNVEPKDLAVLVKPKFPENQDRICVVVQRIPVTEFFPTGVWWFCQFPTPVKTDKYEEYGLIPFATIEDSCLRRIAGPSVLEASPRVLERPVLDAA